MNIIDRVKNILITPKTEWKVIDNEPANVQGILVGYVLPLAIAAAIAAFIGYGLIGFSMFGVTIKGTSWGLYYAVVLIIQAILSVLVAAFVIDALAHSFSSEKNFGKSVQLAAYSFTAAWVGGLLAILPAIAFIGALLGLYGLYLLYIGLPVMKKTPEDKHVVYFVVSLLVLILVYMIIGFVLSKIFMSVFGLSFGYDDMKINM